MKTRTLHYSTPHDKLYGENGTRSGKVCIGWRKSAWHDIMRVMKRVFLFVVVNLAVMMMLSAVMHVVFAFLGPETLESLGFGSEDMGVLMVFPLVFGIGGAFVSLLMSKSMANGNKSD